MAKRPLETWVQVEVFQRGKVTSAPSGGLGEYEEVRLSEMAGKIWQMVVQPEMKVQGMEQVEQLIDAKVDAKIDQLTQELGARISENLRMKEEQVRAEQGTAVTNITPISTMGELFGKARENLARLLSEHGMTMFQESAVETITAC